MGWIFVDKVFGIVIHYVLEVSMKLQVFFVVSPFEYFGSCYFLSSVLLFVTLVLLFWIFPVRFPIPCPSLRVL